MSEIEKIIEKEEQEIECQNCGAHYDIHEPACPFCGATNELGNEGKYLQHLEEIKDDLDDVQYIPQNALVSEAKKTGRKAWKTVSIVLTLVAIVIIVLLIIRNVQNKRLSERITNVIAWQNEYFPILDQMYEEGKYDEILEFQNNLYDSPDYDVLGMGEWEHNDFMNAYRWHDCLVNYKEFYNDQNRIEGVSKELLMYHCAELLYEAWEIKLNNKAITKKEYSKILEYQETAKEFLNVHFGIDESRLEEFRQKVIYDSPGVGVDYSKAAALSQEYEFID